MFVANDDEQMVNYFISHENFAQFCTVNKIRTLDLRTEFFIALARQPHPYKCTLTLQLRQWSGPIEMLVSRIKHRLRVISGLDLL